MFSSSVLLYIITLYGNMITQLACKEKLVSLIFTEEVIYIKKTISYTDLINTCIFVISLLNFIFAYAK